MSNDGKLLVSYGSFSSVDQCSVARMKVFVHSVVVWFAFVLFFKHNFSLRIRCIYS